MISGKTLRGRERRERKAAATDPTAYPTVSKNKKIL
jgi:hypothetical protein